MTTKKNYSVGTKYTDFTNLLPQRDGHDSGIRMYSYDDRFYSVDLRFKRVEGRNFEWLLTEIWDKYERKGVESIDTIFIKPKERK